ncbi:hypothetical protein Tco_0787872 [Tanacetum coccineum]
MKRIFRYLKGQPKLGLWYPKDSPFDLVAYTDSDYARASLDRKSTTRGCQFLGCRLISWQCKKQTVVVNSTTEAEEGCLEWNGKVAKDEIRLQALVDGKKIVITESTIRRDLQLEDAEGTDCLPNATIFEQLTLMGAKTTAWNEFSSTMASAVICLAKNQKFNFLKYIFESMVKNLDNAGKFLMYPKFVQVFLDKQVGDMSNHDRIYVIASHTKKIFRNMKRVGKGFSEKIIPLFPTMMVQAQEEMGEGSTNPTNPHHTPTIIQPSTSQPQKKHKLRRPKQKGTEGSQNTMGDIIAQTGFENVSKTSNDPLLSALDLENTKTAQAHEITSLKLRVKKLEKKGGSRTHKLKRLYKVGLSRRVESSKKESLGEEDASKQGRKIHDIDADEDNTLENEVLVEEVSVVGKLILLALLQQLEQAPTPTPIVSSQQSSHVKVQDKAKIEVDQLLAKSLQAREQEELTIEKRVKLFQQLLKKKRKHFAAKRVEEKRNRPPTKAQQRSIITELVEGTEKEEGTKKAEAKVIEGSSKRVGDELEQENIKKQKVDDDQEAAKMKELMKIIPDEEEVAIDVIPLATKPPSIIDYKIIKEGKINNFQIIRLC